MQTAAFELVQELTVCSKYLKLGSTGDGLDCNCPMERRLPDANDGKRCVSVAVGGKVGILMFALCVASITALLGRRTRIPSATRCTLDKEGVEDLVKKW